MIDPARAEGAEAVDRAGAGKPHLAFDKDPVAEEPEILLRRVQRRQIRQGRRPPPPGEGRAPPTAFARSCTKPFGTAVPPAQTIGIGPVKRGSFFDSPITCCIASIAVSMTSA